MITNQQLRNGVVFMKKRLGLLTITASLLLVACGNSNTAGNDAEPSKDIAVTVNGELASLDSVQSTDTPSQITIANVMEGLYRPADNGSNELGVASAEPTVSEDGLTYTFTIRDDANWSNGDPVTAEDFVYTYKRTVTPETIGGNANKFYVIENAEAIANGEADPDTLGVVAVDDKTLEITLNNPTPYFTDLLATPYFLPMNHTVATELGSDYGTSAENAVYNGPFEVSEWNATEIEWTTVKNEDYWDTENVDLDSIDWVMSKENSTNVNLFEGGELQYTEITTPFVQQYEGNEALSIEPKGMIGYMEFNSQSSPTSNVHFRRAISQAYDRQAFVDAILQDGSIPAGGWIPSEFGSNPGTDVDFREENGDLMAFNVEAAQEEWALALEELGTDSVEIELLTSDTETSKATSEYLQAQLQTNLPGLTVTVRNVPLKSRQAITGTGEFDIVYGTYNPSYADPTAFLDYFVTGSSLSSGDFSDPTYDELMNEGKITNALDPEARWENFLDAERYLVEDAAAVSPIYQGAYASLIDPNLENVINQPNGVAQYYRAATYTAGE